MVDFIGIGAQKAGTTWLWGMLRQHPQVAFAPFKEVHYFDVLYLGMSRSHRLRVIDRAVDAAIQKLSVDGGDASAKDAERLRRFTDRNFAFTDDWYRALFEGFPEGTLTGDITPYYSALPDEGIDHLKRLAPSVRLIYLIRDPIQRGVSSLRHMVNPKRPPEAVLGSKEYFIRGDYRSNIQRWERFFPSDQILYVPFGEIRRDPLGVLRSVEQHLGVRALADYTAMSTPRGSTEASELAVTESMSQRISELFSDQRQYLNERFGAEFVARIS